MSSEDFDYLSQKFGPMDATRPAPADFATRMAKRLPRSLIEFLAAHGFGSWKRGRYQFCDPDDYNDVLADVFENDPDIAASNCEVFGYTSFGYLTVWSRRHQNMLVKLPRGEVEAPRLVSAEKIADDIAVASNLYSVDSDAFDQFDQEGKTLFARTVKKLGPLKLDHCFGFVPMLALGGSADLGNIRMMSAREHFALLAQSSAFRLMDYTKRPAFVREIG